MQPQVPSNMVLIRVGPRVWLPIIIVSWGVVATLFAGLKSSTDFYVLRLLLGVAESGEPFLQLGPFTCGTAWHFSSLPFPPCNVLTACRVSCAGSFPGLHPAPLDSLQLLLIAVLICMSALTLCHTVVRRRRSTDKACYLQACGITCPYSIPTRTWVWRIPGSAWGQPSPR